LPDYLPPTGTITFTPTATALKIKNALPKALTVLPAPITCGIDADGDLCYPLPGEGVVTNKFVNLVATDDPEVNPIAFTYTVSFKLFYNGAVLPLAPFSIEVPLDTEVDLTIVAPVSASGGTQIIRGQDGQDNTLVIGSVTTGEVAGATISGTFPVQTLDLVLPSGGGGGGEQSTGWYRYGGGFDPVKVWVNRTGNTVRMIVQAPTDPAVTDAFVVPSDYSAQAGITPAVPAYGVMMNDSGICGTVRVNTSIAPFYIMSTSTPSSPFASANAQFEYLTLDDFPEAIVLTGFNKLPDNPSVSDFNYA
jgi:hypothetical protein